MSDIQPPLTPDRPTRKQLRDARRKAHGVQKQSRFGKGGDNKGKKGKKGKGDRKP
jgi:hypothetical protein